MTHERFVIIKVESRSVRFTIQAMESAIQKDSKICVFRNRQAKLASFYHIGGGICFCADVDGLMHELG